ncbi:male-specific sperm protein Mst84Da-like [Drosophila hydei]|uniref:Male-specific sperm protein Mst84Da-like n=1 Tax=Drosophila hydei TaxID=7224 RepID=A0A6J1LYU4_DROHY|nr:male-specific sperm protein Mst84Da-like [Drosophila hydei]
MCGGGCGCGPCGGCGPCSVCPTRYLKRSEEHMPCVWCAPCKAHCYNTPPKCGC